MIVRFLPVMCLCNRLLICALTGMTSLERYWFDCFLLHVSVLAHSCQSLYLFRLVCVSFAATAV